MQTDQILQKTIPVFSTGTIIFFNHSVLNGNGISNIKSGSAKPETEIYILRNSSIAPPPLFGESEQMFS